MRSSGSCACIWCSNDQSAARRASVSDAACRGIASRQASERSGPRAVLLLLESSARSGAGGRRAARSTERKAVGGQPSALHCGGRRCASTALRCSVPGGERRTRPPGRHLAARLPSRCSDRLRSTHRLRRSRNPVALRSSAPQRRAAGRPPAALREMTNCLAVAPTSRIPWSHSGLANGSSGA